MTTSHLLAGATEATARQLSRDLEEPDWLLDERLDAVRRMTELPDESNTLWTTVPRPAPSPLRRRGAVPRG